MKTQAAQAAALIRKELKAQGIKASVRSSNYSMGSSINISLINPTPELYKKVEEIAKPYQYGHFNGMEDIYEYSNVTDMPQAKFVFVDREFTADVKQNLADWMAKAFSAETLKDNYGLDWQILCGSASRFSNDFFSSINGMQP